MTVSPTDLELAYHFSLKDDKDNTLNFILSDKQGHPTPLAWSRTSSPKTTLRMNTAAEGYGNMEAPFSNVIQSDWSGGIGSRDLETDSTRYRDGYIADTARALEIRCGPKRTRGDTYVITGDTIGATGQLHQNNGTHSTLYASFTPDTARTVRSMTAFLHPYLTAVAGANLSVTLSVYADLAGAPNIAGGPIGTGGSILIYGPAPSGLAAYNIACSQSFTQGVRYWICLFCYSETCDGYDFATGPFTGEKILDWTRQVFEDGATVANNMTICFEMSNSGISGNVYFFDYLGAKLAVTNPDDGTAPKIYLNGYMSAAVTPFTDKTKINTNLVGIAADALKGKVVKIVAGKGLGEAQNWRKITANSDVAGKCVITVSPSWNITQDATTQIYILGCDNWSPVTVGGTSITRPLSGRPLVVNDMIMFAQGNGYDVIRVHYAAGAWTGANDTGSQCDYLEATQDTKGTIKVWAGIAQTSVVYISNAVSWGGSFNWSTNVTCGDTSHKITNIYGAKIGTSMLPVVFKENGFGAIATEGTTAVFDWYRKFDEMSDDANGIAALLHDVYLWFSLGERIERFYESRLDDIGPDREEGIPGGRRGKVAAMIEYASQVFIAIDAGAYGTSSVYRYNGTGWNEVYRGAYGKRIRALSIQTIPGLDLPQRLWIAEGEDMYWVGLSLNPDQQNGYTYQTGTQIELAWMYGSYRDIIKYWDKVGLFCENLNGSTIGVAVDYKVDSDTEWTYAGTFLNSPVDEIKLSTTGNYVTGRRLKIRLTLYTDNPLISPIITAVRLDCVVRIEPKAALSISAVLVENNPVDLLGFPSVVDAAAMVKQIEDWQSGNLYPAPITLGFWHPINDELEGFVDAVSSGPCDVWISETERKLSQVVSFQFMLV